MNMLEFIKSCNKNLLSFLLGANGLGLNTLTEKTQYALACVIESIYHLYVIQTLYYRIHFLLTWNNFIPQDQKLFP